ncbi:MAG: glycoside hydrolase family 9 protein [Cyanobacteria bacterium P01_G01_bin.19]
MQEITSNLTFPWHIALRLYTSVNGERDELTWGAIWLHKAKKAQNNGYSGSYLTLAEAEYQKMDKPYNYTYQFDDKSYAVYVLLAQETEKQEYQERAEAWLDYWTVGYQGERIKYTPGGLAFLAKWGSLPLTTNTSFVAFIYSDWLRETQGNSAKAELYDNFATSQINYILGDNPAHFLLDRLGVGRKHFCLCNLPRLPQFFCRSG